MSEDGTDGLTEGSETAYQDSLASLTESMAAQLFITTDSGYRYSALNPSYLAPFDEPAKEGERLIALQISALAGSEKRLWVEFEGREGYVDELLGSGRIAEPRVLDIGCGIAGVWLRDVGAAYPKAEVYGLDLAPVESDLLPNVSAEVWDVTEGLPFPDAYFHVVHIRILMYWIPSAFQSLLAEVGRVLAPGGALLLEETDANIVDKDGDDSAMPWRKYESKDEIKLHQIVFKNLTSMLDSCSEDPFAHADNDERAFTVYNHDWTIHLGWRDGEKGEGESRRIEVPFHPPARSALTILLFLPSRPSVHVKASSTRTGNHFACIITRQIYSVYSENQRLPETPDGKPSNRQLLLEELHRTIESNQDDLYITLKTYMAIRRSHPG